MVLRSDSVRERLLKLEEAASGLERILAARRPTPDLRDDWAIERGLQLGAEAVLDIGNHILSAHFGTSARDYEDIITRLGDVGVMSLTQVGIAIPNFWFAILLILLFAVHLQWVSAGGFPGWTEDDGGGLWDGFVALLLPAVSLAVALSSLK